MMALRQHVTGVFKMSSVMLNSLAFETGALACASRISKNTNVPEKINTIARQPSSYLINRHQILSDRMDLPQCLLGIDFLRTAEAEKSTNEYKCPTRLINSFSQMVILDKQINKPEYSLPLSNSIVTSIVDPLSRGQMIEVHDPVPVQHIPGKEAKIIMRIRHKKMKKHKLRKLRKRMYFVFKKQKAIRINRRSAIYWKEIEDIKKEGENFDAETYVKAQLEMARKGGYYQNVFQSKD